jgi:hypothetical protein
VKELYYDPYDVEIDTDPYPVWKRMRDEAPLYYNEKFDFFAVSRFDDVEKGLVDARRYISGRGGHAHLRGPADPHHSQEPAVAGVHAPARRGTRTEDA